MKVTSLAAAAFFTVALPAAPAPAAAPAAVQPAPEAFRRFALAIGSNEGGSGRDTLLYAGSDARSFGALLGQMGGVTPDDVQVLEGPRPEDLDAAFRGLRKKVRDRPKAGLRTEVILYYSGHADERGLLLDGKSYAYDRFRSQIDSIPADVRIAVLDACASGTITRLKGGKRRPAFAVDASSNMRGYAFLTSSSPDEASQESDQIRSSFFTHYLLSGLRGAADVSGDGKVTLGEAYQFAFHETLARTERTKGGPQHPAYDMKLSGTGDVVMTDTRQTTAGLILGKDLEGRFFVRGRDNLLVAELYKPAGRAVELGLAPGSYSIRLEQNKTLATSTLDLVEGRRSEITAKDFTSMRPEATVSRGGPLAVDTADAPPSGGLAVDVQDQVDIPAGRHGKGTLSLGFLLNRQRQPFQGIQLTLFFNQASKSVQGGQASVFGNLAQGPLTGGQLSAIGNIALDTLKGGQGAGTFNFALEGGRGGMGAGTFNVAGDLIGGMGAGVANFGMGSVQGGQGAGVLNVANGLQGGQGAGVLNLNFGPAKGGQGAGVMNVTGGMVGGQGAGVANLAFGDVSGGQGAGVFNVARNVKGAQVAACLNIARDVEGFQIGLVNISRDFKRGLPIGLLNYSHTGLHSLNLWTDELGYQHSTFASGTRSYYTYYSIGKKLASERNLIALGLGIGFQRPFGANHLAADLGAYQLIEDWDFDHDESADAPELYRLRLQAGRELIPYVTVFGGVSLNYLWNLSDRADNLPWEDYPVEPFKGIYTWPGLFAGIRLWR